jgi:hypothetical protein
MSWKLTITDDGTGALLDEFESDEEPNADWWSEYVDENYPGRAVTIKSEEVSEVGND